MKFKDIFLQHQKLVYNLALQYTQNIQDAEEITQDVFVKIFQKHQDFNHQSQIKTWIYRIAINQSLDFLKAKNSQKRGFQNAAIKLDEANHPVHFNHPGVILEQKEEVKKIFDAINQLPSNQKTVLILLKIEGKTQLETAEIMDLSEKAVESLFQRSKKNLENLLQKNEG